MRRLVTLLLAVLAIPLLSHCGTVTEKPVYLLDTSTLRAFQPGDRLVYYVDLSQRITSFVQDIDGSASITWFSSSETVYPGNNRRITDEGLLAREQFSLGTGSASESIDYHYWQDAQGSLYLYAIGLAGDLFWIMPAGGDTPGVELFQSPLPGEKSSNIAFDIYLCEQNNCFQVGRGQQERTYQGIERQTTPYAHFEAYRYSYSFTTESLDTTRFDNDPIADISGMRWYYPRLGIVKFAFSRNTSDERLIIEASLSTTNIALP